MENNILLNIGTNIIANLVSAAIIAAAGIFLVVRVRQRRMKRFFGFTPGRGQQKIYLSTIAVRKAGTRGTAPIREGFYGDAITELEYRHSLQLAASIAERSPSWLFDTIVGPRARAERIVSTIELGVSFRHLVPESADDDTTDDVLVDYDVTDVYSRIDQFPCVVLVGAPIYNLMSYHILANHNACFEFIREERDYSAIRGIRDRRGLEVAEYVREERPEKSDFVDYFIVEKLTVHDTKVFVCAGTCTAATAAALDKLQQWRRFAADFADEDFGVLYRILTSYPDGREREPSDKIEFLR